MKSYVWGNQNQEEVSVESNTDLVSRNIKVTGIEKNALQSRVQGAKKLLISGSGGSKP